MVDPAVDQPAKHIQSVEELCVVQRILLISRSVRNVFSDLDQLMVHLTFRGKMIDGALKWEESRVDPVTMSSVNVCTVQVWCSSFRENSRHVEVNNWFCSVRIMK